MANDWEKELARIDKQLESLSDDALLPPAKEAPKGGAKPVAVAAGRTPAARAGLTGGSEPTPQQLRTRTLGVAARLVLATAVAIGVLFWPYEARCGAGLAGYLGAVGVVALAGAWSAVWSWRHRSARAHVVALVLVGWGLALAAAEVLPRVGYAKADPTRALWVCD